MTTSTSPIRPGNRHQDRDDDGDLAKRDLGREGRRDAAQRTGGHLPQGIPRRGADVVDTVTLSDGTTNVTGADGQPAESDAAGASRVEVVRPPGWVGRSAAAPPPRTRRPAGGRLRCRPRTAAGPGALSSTVPSCTPSTTTATARSPGRGDLRHLQRDHLATATTNGSVTCRRRRPPRLPRRAEWRQRRRRPMRDNVDPDPGTTHEAGAEQGILAPPRTPTTQPGHCRPRRWPTTDPGLHRLRPGQRRPRRGHDRRRRRRRRAGRHQPRSGQRRPATRVPWTRVGATPDV